MSPSLNADKYAEVYSDAKQLSEKTILLKRQSKLLLISNIYSLLLLPLYACLLYLLTDLYGVESKYMIVAITSVLLSLFYILYSVRRNTLKKTMELFFEVDRLYNKLSDKVDWTSMRKRQLYNELDEKIQKTLDDFFEYRISMFCPFCREGQNLQSVMNTLFLLELFMCPILTLVIIL